MKNISSILALSFLMILTACKDTGAPQVIKVISPQEVKEAVSDNDSPQLVDVRTLKEFREGHLENAQNICVTDHDFEENILKLDKNKPAYLYCRSGKRSATAAKILKELGFTEIYDMEGGYLNWENQNFEVKK